MNVKKLQLLLALTLGLLAVAGALMLLGTWSSGPPVALAQSDTRYVSSVSGDDTGDCTDQAAPCATIQYAVDQATGGDEIHIATFDVSGTVIPLNIVTTTARYTGTGTNVVALTKSLTLRGGYVYAHVSGLPTAWAPGIVPATVDGEGTRRALYVSGNVTPTLRLVAFINGNADQGGNVYAEDAHVRFVATPIMTGTATYGGGLYLKNCRGSFDPGDLDWGDLLGFSGLLLVRNNSAQYGGGIYVEEGAPVLAGLAVYSNTATADGGGLYLKGGRPVVAGGLVLENQAGNRGGGLYLADSVARIAGTAVYSNIAADGAGFYLDGPFAFSEQTIPVIANSYVRHNRTTGSQGGGFYFRQAIAGLVNNVIADNQATDGAAMYLWASSPQLFHNTIAQNDGNSGVYLTHKPGQIWPPVIPIPSQPSFTNTIVVSQTVGVYVDSTGLPAPLQNQATLEGTLWWGNGSDTGGPGPVVHSTDVSSDPLFVCTGNLPDCLRPYHILTGSAAVDAGVVVALTIPGSDLFVDIDLELRPSGEGYDIGADEVVSETYSVWLIPPLSALPVAPGQTVTHAHLLMNTGLATDTYDLEALSSSGWATLLADTVITLSAQTSATVQVRVSAPPAATNGMSDTTAITATSRADPDRQARALDVTGVITGDVADLSVGKWADTDLIGPGGAVRFTIVVTNAGPLTETLPVTLTDAVMPPRVIGSWSLPDGCTGVTATGLITCGLSLPGGSVPVSESLAMVVTTTGVYTGPLVNRAAVGAAVLDPNPSNNVAYATVGLTACIPLEGVIVTGPTWGYSGTSVAFTAIVSPPLTTLPVTYTWEATGQSPEDHTRYSIADVITFTWSVTGQQRITVTAVNECSDASDTHVITISTAPLVDLSVNKWADVTTAQAGEAVRYTIAITKSGSLTGTLPVTLTDTFVPAQALAAWQLPDNCTGNEATGLITCTWNLPGDSPLVTRTFAITITITTANVYSGSLVNTATVSAAAIDPDLANNVAQATVGVTAGWRVYLPLVMRNFAP